MSLSKDIKGVATMCSSKDDTYIVQLPREVLSTRVARIRTSFVEAEVCVKVGKEIVKAPGLRALVGRYKRVGVCLSFEKGVLGPLGNPRGELGECEFLRLTGRQLRMLATKGLNSAGRRKNVAVVGLACGESWVQGA